MIGVFKQKNPGNALLLLIYGLILKFPLFLHPVKPLPGIGDNYIYLIVLRLLEPAGHGAPVIYSFLAFLLVFTQATLVNRICNSLKLFPRNNYLVGMAYLLISSLMSEWLYFSAPLLVNSVMIWVWYSMIRLYNNNNPKTSIYNVAVLVGLLPLIYSPAVAFVLLLVMSLVITRPPRITEWMVALLGLLTPYYFLFVILFLTDQWDYNKVVPSVTFHLPRLPASLWITGGIVLLALPFFPGWYYVQTNLNKTLIQVRKAWSLLLSFLVVSLLIILVNPGSTYINWLLVIIPLGAFHGAAYYYTRSRWVGLLLHWITFIYAILLNYELYKNFIKT